jgi:hypothetical protein
MASSAYRTLSSNVCSINKLEVVDKVSFFKVPRSDQLLIEYNIDSIINVLETYGLSFNLNTLTQQAGPIIGTGYTGNSKQGYSVAISSDGNTVAFGAPNNAATIGATWVFIRINNVWSQQFGIIIGTGYGTNPHQGTSVALSSDGNTLAIGGPGDSLNEGATWIFIRTGSSWVQQAMLVGTGGVDISNQGTSVSLSSDGNTLAIGGPNDDNTDNIGAVWIFTRTNSVWSEQDKISDLAVLQQHQGTSVSLSQDGNTLAFGGPEGVGSTWIYTRNGIIWTQQAYLIGTGYVGTSGQGKSVALSPDGNTLVVGAPFNDGGIGTIWIFNRTNTTWTQTIGPLTGTASSGNSNQGISVSIGINTIIVGGNNNNNGIGAYWVYKFTTEWAQFGYKVTASGYTDNPLQGTSVAISTDDTTIIIGGPGNNNDLGAVWTFIS